MYITFLTPIWHRTTETMPKQTLLNMSKADYERSSLKCGLATGTLSIYINLYRSGLTRSSFHRYNIALNLQVSFQFMRRGTSNPWTLFLGYQKWLALSLPALQHWDVHRTQQEIKRKFANFIKVYDIYAYINAIVHIICNILTIPVFMFFPKNLILHECWTVHSFQSPR